MRYGEEFVKRVVEAVRAGASRREVARLLGLSRKTVGRWVRRAAEPELTGQGMQLSIPPVQGRNGMHARPLLRSHVHPEHFFGNLRA